MKEDTNKWERISKNKKQIFVCFPKILYISRVPLFLEYGK